MKANSSALIVLAILPALYLGSYFAFLAWLTPDAPTSHPAVFSIRNPSPHATIDSHQISIVTGDSSATQFGVKLFLPAFKLHARSTGRVILMRNHAAS